MIVCFTIHFLFILGIIVVHGLINHPEVFSDIGLLYSSSFFAEAFFLFVHGIICFVVNYSFLFSLDENLSSPILNMESSSLEAEKRRGVILLVIFSTIICAVANGTVVVCKDILEKNTVTSETFFEHLPCIFIPLICVSILSIITYLLLAKYVSSNQDLTAIIPVPVYDSHLQLRGHLLLLAINLLAVSVVVFDIVSLCLGSFSILGLTDDSLTVGLPTYCYVFLVLHVVLLFYGFISVIRFFFSSLSAHVNPSSAVAVKVVETVITVILAFLCVYICFNIGELDSFSIIAGCSLFSVGGALCLKGKSNDLASAIIVLFKNKIQRGDYIRASGYEGYVQEIDSSGITIANNNACTYVKYSSLREITRFSFPHDCAIYSLFLRNWNDYSQAEKLISVHSKDIVEKSDGLVCSNPIKLFVSKKVRLKNAGCFSKICYLIPCMNDQVEQVQQYFETFVADLFAEKNIPLITKEERHQLDSSEKATAYIQS